MRQLIEDALPERSLNLFCVRSDASMEYTLVNSEIDAAIIGVSCTDSRMSLMRLKAIRNFAPGVEVICISADASASLEGHCRLLGARLFIDTNKLSAESLKIQLGRIFADANDVALC
jgi:hypothetical protein